MNRRFAVNGLLVAFGLLSAAGVALGAKQEKDPTRYDCRVTVRVERYYDGGRIPGVRFVKECPHKDKLVAGQCETSWLWGMRCKK